MVHDSCSFAKGKNDEYPHYQLLNFLPNALGLCHINESAWALRMYDLISFLQKYLSKRPHF